MAPLWGMGSNEWSELGAHSARSSVPIQLTGVAGKPVASRHVSGRRILLRGRKHKSHAPTKPMDASSEPRSNGSRSE